MCEEGRGGEGREGRGVREEGWMERWREEGGRHGQETAKAMERVARGGVGGGGEGEGRGREEGEPPDRCLIGAELSLPAVEDKVLIPPSPPPWTRCLLLFLACLRWCARVATTLWLKNERCAKTRCEQTSRRTTWWRNQLRRSASGKLLERSWMFH